MSEVMTEEERVEEFMFAMHDTVQHPPVAESSVPNDKSPSFVYTITSDEPSLHCPECEQEVYDGLYGYECDRCGLIEPVTL